MTYQIYKGNGDLVAQYEDFNSASKFFLQNTGTLEYGKLYVSYTVDDEDGRFKAIIERDSAGRCFLSGTDGTAYYPSK